MTSHRPSLLTAGASTTALARYRKLANDQLQEGGGCS